jgi:hypothetical protein
MKLLFFGDFLSIPNPAGIEYRRLFAPDANPEAINDADRPSFKPRQGFNSTTFAVGIFYRAMLFCTPPGLTQGNYHFVDSIPAGL